MKKTLCIAIAAAHLSACSTLPPSESGGGISGFGNVQAGDHVIITTASGGRRIQVTSVNEREICGRQECFPTDSIQLVQREELDTVSAVAAALLIVALVALVVGLRSMGPAGFPAGTGAFH